MIGEARATNVDGLDGVDGLDDLDCLVSRHNPDPPHPQESMIERVAAYAGPFVNIGVYRRWDRFIDNYLHLKWLMCESIEMNRPSRFVTYRDLVDAFDAFATSSLSVASGILDFGGSRT